MEQQGLGNGKEAHEPLGQVWGRAERGGPRCEIMKKGRPNVACGPEQEFDFSLDSKTRKEAERPTMGLLM